MSRGDFVLCGKIQHGRVAVVHFGLKLQWQCGKDRNASNNFVKIKSDGQMSRKEDIATIPFLLSYFWRRARWHEVFLFLSYEEPRIVWVVSYIWGNSLSLQLIKISITLFLAKYYQYSFFSYDVEIFLSVLLYLLEYKILKIILSESFWL